MKYLQKSFSVGLGSDKYRDNYDQVFGKKETSKESQEEAPKRVYRCPKCGIEGEQAWRDNKHVGPFMNGCKGCMFFLG